MSPRGSAGPELWPCGFSTALRLPLGRTPFGSTQDRAHGARAQAADKAKSEGELTGKLRFGFRGLDSELSAVARTEICVVRIRSLALGAGANRVPWQV